MSTKSEIDAVVGVFVEDLAEIVRRALLDEIRRVLLADGPAGESAGKLADRGEPRRASVKTNTSRASAAKAGPARTARTGAKPKARSASAEPAPEAETAPTPPAPEPPRRKLDFQRRGRVFVIPSSASAEPTLLFDPTKPDLMADLSPTAPLPPVQRLPPRVRRAPRASTPPPAPAPVETAAPAEPVPAKNWVVVRRPARDRVANGNGPDSSEAPSSSAPVTQPAAGAAAAAATTALDNT